MWRAVTPRPAAEEPPVIHLPTRSRLVTVATVLVLVSSTAQAVASTPTAGTLGPPTSGQVSRVSWTGGLMTAAAPFVPAFSCDAPVCDNHDLTLNIPVDFWDTREGAVVVDVSWTGAADDFDVWVEDANGRLVKAGTSSAVRLAKSEQVSLTWLTETGAPIGEVAALSTTLVETSGVRTLTGSLSAPTGATAARVTLSAPTSLLSGQTTWIDDVWMW